MHVYRTGSHHTWFALQDALVLLVGAGGLARTHRAAAARRARGAAAVGSGVGSDVGDADVVADGWTVADGVGPSPPAAHADTAMTDASSATTADETLILLRIISDPRSIPDSPTRDPRGRCAPDRRRSADIVNG